MTTNMDGDAIDPRVARVFLIYREAVAEATERAVRELRELGVDPAVSRPLYAMRSSIGSTFADELARVPVPEFVAPPVGSWIAEVWGSGRNVGTWHRATSRHQPSLSRASWPRVMTRCGRGIQASWNQDGDPMVELAVVAEEPVVACGHCRRLSGAA